MKLETILDAMIGTSLYSFEWTDEDKAKRERQYRAFRARILRMFEDLEEEIEYLVEYGNR